MEQWTRILNKQVKLIFEDGKDHFSKKEGLLTEVNATHLIIQVNDSFEVIKLEKVLRMEAKEKWK